jgi:hypothetical protein
LSRRSGGGGDGTGSPCGAAGSGAWTTEAGGADGGDAACGQATSAASINIAVPRAATRILEGAKWLPDRSSMTSTVTPSGEPAR